jgi:hypothetical protein
LENLFLKTAKIAPLWKGLMLNDDDFPALPNSTGQNSQQQVQLILSIICIKSNLLLRRIYQEQLPEMRS